MTMPLETQLAANLDSIRQRMQAACGRAGRPAEAVTLVAVTKYARLDWVRALTAFGTLDLGESRPQQLAARAVELDGAIRWHLIGHLQRNKARRILPLVARIHSVDSLRLLTFLDNLAGELDLRPPVLLEVNVSGEESKNGFAPEDLLQQWPVVLACRQVRVDGLMTMAPLHDDPERSRPVFASLRRLRDRLQELSPPGRGLPELSMGMSGDFEVAIEEGATFIRLGSDLFEGLPTRSS